jgi:hypothetical protein
VARWPVFGEHIMRKIENMAVTTEDMAETAALGASAAFSRSIRKEIRSAVHEHQRHAKSA